MYTYIYIYIYIHSRAPTGQATIQTRQTQCPAMKGEFGADD